MQAKRRVKTMQTTHGTRTSLAPVVLVKSVGFDRYNTSPELVRALMEKINTSILTLVEKKQFNVSTTVSSSIRFH